MWVHFREIKRRECINIKIKELLSTWQSDSDSSVSIVDLDKKEIFDLSKQEGIRKFGEYQIKSWYAADDGYRLTIWIRTKKIKVWF